MWLAIADHSKVDVWKNAPLTAQLKEYVLSGGHVLLTHFAPLLIERLVEGEIGPDSVWGNNFKDTGGGYKIVDQEHHLLRCMSPVLLLASVGAGGEGGFPQFTARYSARRPLKGRVLAENTFGSDADVVEWRVGKGRVIMASEWLSFSARGNRAQHNVERMAESLICSMAGVVPAWYRELEMGKRREALESLGLTLDRIEGIAQKALSGLALLGGSCRRGRRRGYLRRLWRVRSSAEAGKIAVRSWLQAWTSC